MQLKAVIFDFGNVISLPTRHERVLSLTEQLEIPREDFLAAYHGQRSLPGKGYRTGILSNLPSYYAEYFRNHFSWLNGFDGITFSCDVGSVKPEPEIYQACLSSLAIEAGQALFLDDLKVNVEAAKRIGMHSEVFVSFGATIPFVMDKYGI